MTHKICRTLIASVGAVALVLAASEALADPAITHVGGLAPPHPVSPSPAGRPTHRHRGTGVFWPSAGDYYYGPSYDEQPMMDARPPRASDDIRYTCTLDIPWDYVHRCPQPVAPSE
jgi:hypothetical protein